jgi:hypothetical protein
MGDVMGQITAKRGHVLGMESADGTQHLRAQVPQAEMFHYATELRSITQGRGRFSQRLDHYAEVPHPIAEKVIAEHQAKSPPPNEGTEPTAKAGQVRLTRAAERLPTRTSCVIPAANIRFSSACTSPSTRTPPWRTRRRPTPRDDANPATTSRSGRLMPASGRDLQVEIVIPSPRLAFSAWAVSRHRHARDTISRAACFALDGSGRPEPARNLIGPGYGL